MILISGLALAAVAVKGAGTIGNDGVTYWSFIDRGCCQFYSTWYVGQSLVAPKPFSMRKCQNACEKDADCHSFESRLGFIEKNGRARKQWECYLFGEDHPAVVEATKACPANKHIHVGGSKRAQRAWCGKQGVAPTKPPSPPPTPLILQGEYRAGKWCGPLQDLTPIGDVLRIPQHGIQHVHDRCAKACDDEPTCNYARLSYSFTCNLCIANCWLYTECPIQDVPSYTNADAQHVYVKTVASTKPPSPPSPPATPVIQQGEYEAGKWCGPSQDLTPIGDVLRIPQHGIQHVHDRCAKACDDEPTCNYAQLSYSFTCNLCIANCRLYAECPIQDVPSYTNADAQHVYVKNPTSTRRLLLN